MRYVKRFVILAYSVSLGQWQPVGFHSEKLDVPLNFKTKDLAEMSAQRHHGSFVKLLNMERYELPMFKVEAWLFPIGTPYVSSMPNLDTIYWSE